MGIRTPNDKITKGERAFILASTKKAVMEGDVPVKIRNFNSSKKESGGKS